MTLPDGRSLTELARLHTVEAVDALVRIVQDRQVDARAIIMAANGLLDRGWGRPSQQMQLTGLGDIAGEIEAARIRAMSETERAVRIASLLDGAMRRDPEAFEDSPSSGTLRTTDATADASKG